MKKVYCENCSYWEPDIFRDFCHAPENRLLHKCPKCRYSFNYLPQDINKNNDCTWYNPKEKSNMKTLLNLLVNIIILPYTYIIYCFRCIIHSLPALKPIEKYIKSLNKHFLFDKINHKK